ncbi:MAG: U32 family peptidase [Alphaproteobacteria bacterium]|jgi:collagenase-like PrtC family protease|nr:U32 family peptidase [Alphaproteobacteria bacterium]MDP6237506.1 U32 family peptidase [Alphaproteobacteria bacterium]MDP7172901.1 U32 family peptidase [Alphaproteobacteria bacterium]MDP7233049.1 U32 family peptidase [Alphaproteobacteria bacterium]MDP7487612.1 U32 family peptidase [Alphaproteobacteria bacterium]|tara:strand:+ start:521 stop:1420 length:900 start_codon:yes stop_codon:yes gene_type:complete
MSDRILLSLGPCFFNWSTNDLANFYARIADEAPVDRVYLGEVICGKRMPFTDPLWPGLIERLERAGKSVVVSMLALPTTTRERAAMQELVTLDRAVEINDVSGIAAREGRPSVAGPFLNIYNEVALTALAAHGIDCWCPTVELPLASITTVAQACPDIEVELFAFGRLPLAVSGRCTHARLHGLNKDSCGFVCENDKEGMAVETLDGRAFLAANGIQTLSANVQCTLMTTEALQTAGVSRLRLSPHSVDMIVVARIYRAMLDRELTPTEAENCLTELSLPGEPCNAYLAGEPGWQKIPV